MAFMAVDACNYAHISAYAHRSTKKYAGHSPHFRTHLSGRHLEIPFGSAGTGEPRWVGRPLSGAKQPSDAGNDEALCTPGARKAPRREIAETRAQVGDGAALSAPPSTFYGLGVSSAPTGAPARGEGPMPIAVMSVH